MTNSYDLFRNSKDLSESELELAKITSTQLLEIFNDYNKLYKRLEIEISYLSNQLVLNEKINSVKWRVKDPVHLLVKIVRKRKEALKTGDTSSKYLKINVANYKQIITDLIGIRGIYLFKAYWKKIDEYICENFSIADKQDICIFHAPEDDLDFYYPHEFIKSSKGKEIRYLRVEKSTKYRSTHYIIDTNLPEIKLELQVRSILDEAWGEIDHYLRYPDKQDDKDLSRKMLLLNQSINTCEESANTYYKEFQNRTIESIDQVVDDVKNIINNDENQLSNNIFVESSISTEKVSNNLLKQIAFNSDAVRYFETIEQSMPENEILTKQLEAFKAASKPNEAMVKQLEAFRVASTPAAEAMVKQLEAFRVASTPAAEAMVKQLEAFRVASKPNDAMAKQLEAFRVASKPNDAITKHLTELSTNRSVVTNDEVKKKKKKIDDTE